METNHTREKNLHIRCAWMYHDLMDLYGDKGNILSLQKRSQQHGIDFEVDTIAIGQPADLSEYDLIFIGGGADKEQEHIMPDLFARRENLARAMEEKSFILLICGGYQFFGQYYLDANDVKIDGLGFFDYYTEALPEGKRCIGNVVIEADLDGQELTLIGFENHGGQTRNVQTPLGKVRFGNGNVLGGEAEGFYNGQVLGTYLHGPLLPKNSALTDFILLRALQKKHPEMSMADLKPVPISYEVQARKQLLERFGLNDLLEKENRK